MHAPRVLLAAALLGITIPLHAQVRTKRAAPPTVAGPTMEETQRWVSTELPPMTPTIMEFLVGTDLERYWVDHAELSNCALTLVIADSTVWYERAEDPKNPPVRRPTRRRTVHVPGARLSPSAVTVERKVREAARGQPEVAYWEVAFGPPHAPTSEVLWLRTEDLALRVQRGLRHIGTLCGAARPTF